MLGLISLLGFFERLIERNLMVLFLDGRAIAKWLIVHDLGGYVFE